MTKWEYLAYPMPSGASVAVVSEKLNEYGSRGWENYSFINNMLLFKRPRATR